MKTYPRLQTLLGIRIVKTALATTVSVMIADFLNLDSVYLAGIAAIISMTSSVSNSYTNSINRIVSTIMGAAMAIFFYKIGFVNYITLALGIILLTNILNYMNWKPAISLALIVFLIISVHFNHIENFNIIHYSANRILCTAIGLAVGFLVNYSILPPSRVQIIVKLYTSSMEKIDAILLNLLGDGGQVNIEALIDDIGKLNEELRILQADSKIIENKDIKLSSLKKFLSQILSSLGILYQFSSHQVVPNISEENQAKLEDYFGKPVEVKEVDTDDDFEIAYNFYLGQLLDSMEALNDESILLEDRIKKTATSLS